MTTLLAATLLLFLLWPAYALLLRYSDRYGLNRFLLLLAMAAVGALPFVSLPSPAPMATQSVRGTVAYLEESVRPSVAVVPQDQSAYLSDAGGEMLEEVPAEATSVDVLPLVYGIGLGIMLLVLGVRLLLILALHLRSRLNGDGTYRLLHPGASPGQAFTFGRNLYFSIDVPDDADFRHILAHERVHARQGHTVDILLSELFLCVFWFHPAAWWLRTKTRANLEYLVDRAVVSGGADRRDYQLALVRQSQGAYGLALALPFSEPTLKSRIARMTGLPEYRVVALLASVALVFWLGVTLLVVNGTVFGDAPPTGTDYLEAAAHPGDPYYEHYQRTLPEELTSLEIYTNRMVTLDEYLQLRAILAKVPGAKLYVFKNRFDEGYSLELRYGDSDRAYAHRLHPEPLVENTSFLGLVYGSKSTGAEPELMGIQADLVGNSGSPEGLIFHFTDNRKGPALDFFKRRKDDLDGDLQVYVNFQQINLLERSNNDVVPVKINGTEISDFGADDWLKITVEGRTPLEPNERLRLILGLPATRQQNESTSFLSARQKEGTYRKWYEGFGFPKGQPVFARYNDRNVSLDFLLDTEFGEQSMIQHGVVYDTPMDLYALQVIDDVPLPDFSWSLKLNDPPGDIFPAADKIDLFFRRLPTPAEVAKIRPYLSSFPDHGIRVFQDCNHSEGEYTLYLGNDFGAKNSGFSPLAEGEAYDGPLHFSLWRQTSGKVKSINHKPGPEPENAPNSDVFLLIDGVYVNIHSANAEPYTKANLDSAPDAAALKCKLSGLKPASPSLKNFWPNLTRSFWMYTYKATHPGMLEGFHARLEEEGFGDRLAICYINDRVVTNEEFDRYQGGEGSYVRMGTWSNLDKTPVVMEIVD